MEASRAAPRALASSTAPIRPGPGWSRSCGTPARCSAAVSIRPGRFVFAGAQDNTIQRWHLAGGQKTALRGHRSWVRALAFHGAEKQLLSGGYARPGAALAARTPTRRRPSDPLTPTRLGAGPGGQPRRPTLRHLRQRPARQALVHHRRHSWSATFAGHESHVYNVAFHPAGTHLASADLHGHVKDWDLTHRHGGARRWMRRCCTTTTRRSGPTIGGVRSMAFSADGTLLACAGITDVTNAFAGIGKPVVVLFDWQTGKRRQLLRPQARLPGHRLGRRLPSGRLHRRRRRRQRRRPVVLEAEQAAIVPHLELPNNARDLHLHPDGHRLAVPFFDGAVRASTRCSHIGMPSRYDTACRLLQ